MKPYLALLSLALKETQGRNAVLQAGLGCIFTHRGNNCPNKPKLFSHQPQERGCTLKSSAPELNPHK